VWRYWHISQRMMNDIKQMLTNQLTALDKELESMNTKSFQIKVDIRKLEKIKASTEKQLKELE
jgi:predicted  nucleic acid-binding Zn-ribbon protein